MCELLISCLLEFLCAGDRTALSLISDHFKIGTEFNKKKWFF